MAGGFLAGHRTLSAISQLTAAIRGETVAQVGLSLAMDRLRRSQEGLSALTDGIGDMVGELRRQQLFTGGTAGQVGAQASAFASIGLSPSQIAPIADAFRERLFRDPIAIGAFGRSVVTPRLGGPQNSAQILNEAIRLLRDTTDAEERLLKARRLGLEALLPLADLDEKHSRALMREGAIKGSMVDKELRELRAVEQSQQQRLQDLKDQRGLELERSRLRLRNWWRDNITLPIEEFKNRGGPLPPLGGKAGEAAAKAQESQASALDNNTVALNNLRKEFANAGPRAAGAMPAGLRGDALQKALDTHSIRLGAFSLALLASVFLYQAFPSVGVL